MVLGGSDIQFIKTKNTTGELEIQVSNGLRSSRINSNLSIINKLNNHNLNNKILDCKNKTQIYTPIIII